MARVEIINNLLQATEQLNTLIQKLNKKIDQENDGLLKNITETIEQRKLLIEYLQVQLAGEKASWNEEESQLIAKLETADKQVAPRLASLMESYKSEMNRMQQGKKAFQKYQQPKSSLHTDGAFIDKRQ
jgi:hypothetical protein